MFPFERSISVLIRQGYQDGRDVTGMWWLRRRLGSDKKNLALNQRLRFVVRALVTILVFKASLLFTYNAYQNGQTISPGSQLLTWAT